MRNTYTCISLSVLKVHVSCVFQEMFCQIVWCIAWCIIKGLPDSTWNYTLKFADQIPFINHYNSCFNMCPSIVNHTAQIWSIRETDLPASIALGEFHHVKFCLPNLCYVLSIITCLLLLIWLTCLQFNKLHNIWAFLLSLLCSLSRSAPWYLFDK